MFLKACLGCLSALFLALCASAPSYADKPATPKPKPEPKKPGAYVSTAARATGGDHPVISKDKAVPKQKGEYELRGFVSVGGGWFGYFDTFRKGRSSSGEDEQWFGYLGIGFRYRSFELDVRVGVGHVVHMGGTGYFNDPTRVRLSLLGIEAAVGVYWYSIRFQRLRMRHGACLGAYIPLATKCRFYDESRCDQLRSDLRLKATPLGLVHVWDIGIRLVRGLWFEVSLLNVGYPVVISVSAGLRWESGRLGG